jgi:hypothetical protein
VKFIYAIAREAGLDEQELADWTRNCTTRKSIIESSRRLDVDRGAAATAQRGRLSYPTLPMTMSEEESDDEGALSVVGPQESVAITPPPHDRDALEEHRDSLLPPARTRL